MWSGGGSILFHEFVIAGFIACVSQNSDERGHDVRIDGCRVFSVPLIANRCLVLSRSIIAEPPEGAKQLSAQLSNKI